MRKKQLLSYLHEKIRHAKGRPSQTLDQDGFSADAI